jgi:hypothetical protein
MFPVPIQHGVRRPVSEADTLWWVNAQRKLSTYYEFTCYMKVSGVMGSKWKVRALKLTPEEYSALQRNSDPGLPRSNLAARRTETQQLIIRTCSDLWPSSSKEHVALRHLVPYVFSLSYSSLFDEGTCLRKYGIRLKRWFASRRSDDANYAEIDYVETENASTNPDQTGTQGSPTPAGTETPQGPAPPQPPRRDDNDHRVDAQENGRVVTSNGEPVIRAATVMPSMAPARIDANTATNVRAAIDGRVHAKQNVPKMPKELRSRVHRVVNTMLYGQTTGAKIDAVYCEKAVRAWLVANDLDMSCSTKWTEPRLRNAVHNLLGEIDPQYTFSAAVKAEPMAEGKPPRMLIADGDEGQVMALMVVKCIEDITFALYEGRSIKHAPKRDAILRVANNVRELKTRERRKVLVMEGDGSAWDTTCTPPLRNEAELPIIRHITNLMIKHCNVIPEAWHKAHLASCETNVLEIKLPKSYFEHLWAIRRSGHRGTSIFNWVVNFVMWCACAFEDGYLLVNPSTLTVTDLEKRKVRARFAFEGDDSLVSITGASDTLFKLIEKNFKDAGFNMKLFVKERLAEFCGYIIVIDDRGPTQLVSPDLPRALKNGGVSCSAAAVAAAKDDKDVDLKRVAASKALAYAHQFAPTCPTLASKYLSYAQDLGVPEALEREDLIKVAGASDKVMLPEQVIAAITEAMATEDQEKAYLKEFGWGITMDEVARFVNYTWDFNRLRDHEGFAASLPESWKP